MPPLSCPSLGLVERAKPQILVASWESQVHPQCHSPLRNKALLKGYYDHEVLIIPALFLEGRLALEGGAPLDSLHMGRECECH